MGRNNLINSCRYYDGSGYCKYDVLVIPTLWHIEEMWVDLMESENDTVKSAMNSYIAQGLADFCKDDGVPITLKAILRNRLEYYGHCTDIDSFKNFYLKYYGEND